MTRYLIKFTHKDGTNWIHQDDYARDLNFITKDAIAEVIKANFRDKAIRYADIIKIEKTTIEIIENIDTELETAKSRISDVLALKSI
jgi:adenylate kinase